MSQIIDPQRADSWSYPAPRGNVALLTCMDLRVLDETVRFMTHDNLTNRYDHLIVAGASLGAMGCGKPEYEHWKKFFFEHLKIAHDLHQFRDVYLMEHRNCGAYREFLGAEGTFDDSPEDFQRETECHCKYALALKAEIDAWAAKLGLAIRVHCFLMGLRGEVTLLTPEDAPPKEKKPSPKRPKGRG